MTDLLPFFPRELFAGDRDVMLRILFRTGTSPVQEFTLGPAVRRLEETIGADTGARHTIACGNGSGALSLVLRALGTGRGDEVIVPAYGCQPLADTVVNCGATPVFVDVSAGSPVIDPAAVAAAVTERTTTIMPAHVFSVMADMRALGAIARRHGLRVVEDAAVGQGATLAGVPAGRWGTAGVYSFSQYKPLGAAGEGGIVLTDDDEVGEACRSLRHADGGRMGVLTARFLTHRRDGLATRLRRKVEIADRYTEAFSPLVADGLVTLLPTVSAGSRWCHVYAIFTDLREELRAHLRSRGIGTHVYYPAPLPDQPAFAPFAGDRRFPNAEAIGRRNLALPVWAGLSDADVAYVVDSVMRFFRR